MNEVRPVRNTRFFSSEFCQRTLDALLAHIAILKDDGTIVAVNAAWNRFARINQLDYRQWGPGANYLRVCSQATGECAQEAPAMAAGIKDVISKKRADFYLEYPCHAPTKKRWFSVRVTRFEEAGSVFVVVAHDNITQRVSAELRLLEANRTLELQATTDPLTGIGNRRFFDERMDWEWKRHERARLPISVLLLDVDCFKEFNDCQGPFAGDECLKAIARVFKSAAYRAGDTVARYGREEFAGILPETPEAGALIVSERIVLAVRDLAIPHPATNMPSGIVTVSIGCATAIPCSSLSPFELLHRADAALYAAKSRGGDCVMSNTTLDCVAAV